MRTLSDLRKSVPNKKLKQIEFRAYEKPSRDMYDESTALYRAMLEMSYTSWRVLFRNKHIGVVIFTPNPKRVEFSFENLHGKVFHSMVKHTDDMCVMLPRLAVQIKQELNSKRLKRSNQFKLGKRCKNITIEFEKIHDDENAFSILSCSNTEKRKIGILRYNHKQHFNRIDVFNYRQKRILSQRTMYGRDNAVEYAKRLIISDYLHYMT